MEARPDGGARFSLQYKHPDRGGIQRMSCDLSDNDLVELVLFAEALSLNESLGQPQDSTVELDGLRLSRSASASHLHVVRVAGYSQQDTQLPLRRFLAEMPLMTDLCMAVADAQKTGPLLQELLSECRLPDALAARLPQDQADQILHQLREIAFLVLSRQAGVRGSDLGRTLRAKKSRPQAESLTQGLVYSLAEGVIPTASEAEDFDPAGAAIRDPQADLL